MLKSVIKAVNLPFQPCIIPPKKTWQNIPFYASLKPLGIDKLGHVCPQVISEPCLPNCTLVRLTLQVESSTLACNSHWGYIMFICRNLVPYTSNS